MNESANAFRAGLVAIIAVAIGMYFFVSSRKSTLNPTNSDKFYAYFIDASGLNAKSLITVAGLQVGEIRSIRLVEVPFGELNADAEGPLEPEPEPEDEPADAGPPPAGLFGFPSAPEGKKKPKPRPPPETLVKVARVDMRISRDVPLPTDSWLKKETLGLLGAKAIFLELGSSKDIIAPGGRITHVRSLTGLDVLQTRAETIITAVQDIIPRVEDNLAGIVADVKGITGTLNKFIQGDDDNPPLDEVYDMIVDEVRKMVVTVEKTVKDIDGVVVENDKAVKELLANLERISNDINDITKPAGVTDGGVAVGGNLRETARSIRVITDDLEVVTGSLRDLVGENEGEVTDQVKRLKHTLDELNSSLSNLSEITGRIERGEGTVGRLLTDEQMADKLENAVTEASEFVTDLTSLETHIDLGTWYSVRRGTANVAFGLRIQPRPDKYYFLEIVDDGGGVERVTQTVEGFAPTPSGSAFVRRESVYQDDNTLRFTANFAKKFFDFLVLRAGIIETSGGVGADMFFLQDRVQLRTDLYNWGGPRNRIGNEDIRYQGLYLPRWRTMLKAQPIPYVYVMAGVDDALNAVNYDGFLQGDYTLRLNDPYFHGYGLDYFVGVGITFKDDDLRTILPFAPSF